MVRERLGNPSWEGEAHRGGALRSASPSPRRIDLPGSDYASTSTRFLDISVRHCCRSVRGLVTRSPTDLFHRRCSVFTSSGRLRNQNWTGAFSANLAQSIDLNALLRLGQSCIHISTRVPGSQQGQRLS